MVVMNMNSKRIRKPNVRLWEVGDFSAALACTVSSRFTKGNLGIEKWLYDPHFNQGYDVCPRMSEDLLFNTENNDPNSTEPVSGSTSPSIATYKQKLSIDFDSVKRKVRSVRLKPRRRRSEHEYSSPFGCQWKAETDYKDSSDDLTPSMSKEHGMFHTSDSGFITEMRGKSNELVGNGNDIAAKPTFYNCVVKGWLEELGFGGFATLFEIHEVDEEALPLLTIEDLKEMGIVAVGPRRKLFVAIEKLRGAKYIN